MKGVAGNLKRETCQKEMDPQFPISSFQFLVIEP